MRALDDISFTLTRGTVTAVLGPNGAGKTTLLKIISTLISPDSGTVKVNGLPFGKDDDRIRASIGLVSSSERGFYCRLTGRQNLDFFAAMYGLDKSRANARIEELFSLFGITYGKRRFNSYSTGMQQKFALARALLHDPGMLLLDEPTKSLDYSAALAFKRLIKDVLVKRYGKTVLFTTHLMDEAIDFADSFIVLDKGKLLARGTLEELRKKTSSPSASLGEIFLKLTEET
ncbi:MAG: ABC transporter ATP-binding protein [Candidatus Omnitrophica bacterium]|nr:ABC transporter ATP-binding protein [Candidatus Omnitrophota bacterium]